MSLTAEGLGAVRGLGDPTVVRNPGDPPHRGHALGDVGGGLLALGGHQVEVLVHTACISEAA